MGMAEAKVAEILENQAGIFVKTTDTKPTLTDTEKYTICTVYDDATDLVDSIWVWTGTKWIKY